VDDLCSLVQPRLAELQQPGNVHFTDKGYDVLGEQVAAEILEILAAAPTQPIQVK
jgi:lysophospholipase L1-like esterase